MVRPIKNKSVFLDGESEKILLAASHKETTLQYQPDELMSEGWLAVIRYGDEHKYMYFNCRRAMYQYKIRKNLKQERLLSLHRSEEVKDNTVFWIDILDGLTPNEKATLLLYYKCKNTMDEVGRLLGVTGEAIRIRLIKIYKKFERDKE